MATTYHARDEKNRWCGHNHRKQRSAFACADAQGWDKYHIYVKEGNETRWVGSYGCEEYEKRTLMSRPESEEMADWVYFQCLESRIPVNASNVTTLLTREFGREFAAKHSASIFRTLRTHWGNSIDRANTPHTDLYDLFE